MKRNLQPNWQFLLSSQIRRGVWMLDPQVAEAERDMLEAFLVTGKIPELGSLPDEIPLSAVSADEVSNQISLAEAPDGSCAIINIIGTLFRYGSICNYGSDEYAAMLNECLSASNISSVLLNIDSGGGEISAIAPLLQSISALRGAGKPVVASVDLCGSATYWVASYCDKIFANNNVSAQIGCIGTIATVINHRERDKQEGVEVIEIYAPQSVDKNIEHRQAIEGNYDPMKQNCLYPLTQSFIDGIKAARPGLDLEVMTGKLYFAQDAERLGLIDGIKSQQEAAQCAMDLAAITDFMNQK